ncbi:hypothetical protein H5410_026378 [Solanum commersonii]|uniref:Uncharacterized protein n=1 Tax=Solanum commersonii TaxID=4109 RepID=A0A9J5Z1C3_SOLCO|nr:hypothetical protein H5410_026378 [Solanum commersonii]
MICTVYGVFSSSRLAASSDRPIPVHPDTGQQPDQTVIFFIRYPTLVVVDSSAGGGGDRKRPVLPEPVLVTGFRYRNRSYRKFPMVPSGPLVTGLEPVWTGPEPALTGSFMYR